MKLEIPIIVGFDDMESLLDDLKKLQTYKLSEGDDMVLVDVDDVADVLAKHIKAEEKQPEIIRCKDCKYHTGPWYCEAWNNSPGFPAVGEDGYCWMAERVNADE